MYTPLLEVELKTTILCLENVYRWVRVGMDGSFPLWKSVQPIIYGLLNVEESGNRDASFKFFTVDKYNMSLVYILGLRYVY